MEATYLRGFIHFFGAIACFDSWLLHVGAAEKWGFSPLLSPLAPVSLTCMILGSPYVFAAEVHYVGVSEKTKCSLHW